MIIAYHRWQIRYKYSISFNGRASCNGGLKVRFQNPFPPPIHSYLSIFFFFLGGEGKRNNPKIKFVIHESLFLYSTIFCQITLINLHYYGITYSFIWRRKKVICIIIKGEISPSIWADWVNEWMNWMSLEI